MYFPYLSLLVKGSMSRCGNKLVMSLELSSFTINAETRVSFGTDYCKNIHHWNQITTSHKKLTAVC